MIDFIKDFFDCFDALFKTNKNDNYSFSSQDWQELEHFLNNKKQNNYEKPKKTLNPNEDIMIDYANLNLDFTKNIEVVRKAYKKLVIEYHPDKYSDEKLKETASKIIVKLNKSYTRLSNYIKSLN